MKIIWDRIHRWLDRHAPHVLASLKPGASEEQIRAAEQALGVTFPDDVKLCYRIHDGQQEVPVPVSYWPDLRTVPGFLQGDHWFSLEDMVDTWRMLKGLLDDGSFDQARSFPHGPIRTDWWHPRWIPVADCGCGDLRCLDLAPRSRGKVGQVIDWDHAASDRSVIARSMTAWLAGFADDLEDGEYTTALDQTPGLIHISDL
jgi:cell wall assembly regulator SMI1